MPVKEKIGIVMSNKMEKTIVVKVESRFSHPLYSKTTPCVTITGSTRNALRADDLSSDKWSSKYAPR